MGRRDGAGRDDIENLGKAFNIPVDHFSGRRSDAIAGNFQPRSPGRSRAGFAVFDGDYFIALHINLPDSKTIGMGSRLAMIDVVQTNREQNIFGDTERGDIGIDGDAARVGDAGLQYAEFSELPYDLDRAVNGS